MLPADREAKMEIPGYMSGPVAQRGAIVLSLWDWSAYNVPERLAIALSRAGWRVLYCRNPSSIMHHKGSSYGDLSDGVVGCWPHSLGHRLNILPLARNWQTKWLVRQVLRGAGEIALQRPVVIYSHGHWLREIAAEMKARGFFLVYLCVDFLEPARLKELAALSDMCLVIPRTIYDKLRADYGEKIQWIPQFGPDISTPRQELAAPAVTRTKTIPRPRLAYLGPPRDRLQGGLIAALLNTHPDWHFLTCGPVPGLKLENLHDIGWMSPAEIVEFAAEIDAGFMPYDCAKDINRHCVPLKLYDYFAVGLPVISTPLLNLVEYGDLVYVGATADELEAAVRQALVEPAGDPRREMRRHIARSHSTDEMAKLLNSVLTQTTELP